MRTLAIGLFVLCAATAYADDIDDLEQRIDDLESKIDDLRSPRPALPALPPGWKWRFVTYAEDPVNWGWQKVPPPKTAEQRAVELRAAECDRLYQRYVHPPGPGTLTLEWVKCLTSDQSSAGTYHQP